ncbi:DNA topoisomerase I [Methanofollis aquaemaris]|uniref:DNA topoisomerase 1 n=1 Tax=Methanofollis aquaemaris TaxID=126734 RepID=A0A8A3S7N0_9EURY|nr:DNA topoisomerase I [Methanofollis aquaemaris]QSZ68042.1 DNA topoisomerase I [Methanofollis aquaemaris]
MRLIVAEKNISARRVAAILAEDQRVATKKEGGVDTYSFGDTTVVGLKGHVVEVDFEPGYTNWRSAERPPRSLIDAGTVKRPTEKKIVALLQKMAKKADQVIIATDFDAEGELIGKEALELVQAVNPRVPILRARFSAITPQEIRRAFAEPTELDFALAAAGESRQIIDLVWGASLTRFISIAARRGGANILSVGRVQSPTLAMIVDREREIERFVPEPYWMLTLQTEKDHTPLELRHTAGRFTDRDEAFGAKERTKDPLTVTEVKEGVKHDRAPTPFDTTALLVAAGRVGISAANAMRIAEDLYMNGFISYPRTDNTVYPATLDLDEVLGMLTKTAFANETRWVEKHRRPTPTRGKKSSTDHPPIHPTGPATREQLGEDRWKLYELVVRRFLATLSPDAEWATMKVNFDAGGEPYTATGGRLKEEGWRRVYPYSRAAERIIPVCTVGERLPILSVDLEEKETQPPPRYTQSRLIQTMEELGLGTKSTRHEVIQKLISRRYVQDGPLRPTLVGRAVIESLEAHADTITRPDMTRTLEAHMQLIKERKKSGEDVVNESRGMLHSVFEGLEAHEDQIGEGIIDRTVAERTIGPCPVCGKDLQLRQAHGASQFIGCSGYPECTFNISLPGVMWGKAIRVEKVCEEHGLSHVRLIRKGARPWDIGCPLCSHIESNAETLRMMPSMSPGLLAELQARHIYTVPEIARMTPEDLAGRLGIGTKTAATLVAEANDVLDLLRRRSEMKKFIRAEVPPRRRRSHAKIAKQLIEAGIDDIQSLGGAKPGLLKKAGLSDEETEHLLTRAREVNSEKRLKEAGLPAVSVKKYVAAGISGPEDFAALHPAYISAVSGVRVETVWKHAQTACEALGREPPEKITQKKLESGKKELLQVSGIGEATIERLYLAGITDAASLAAADPKEAAAKSGIAVEKIRAYVASISTERKTKK